MVVIMAAMVAEATAVVVIMAAMVAEATALVVTPNPTLLTLINLLAQKVGKIEVMEILLKLLIMKVVESEEKGVFPIKVIRQMTKLSNLFL